MKLMIQQMNNVGKTKLKITMARVKAAKKSQEICQIKGG